MPKLNLDSYTKEKKETLEVRLGDKTYNIPLAGNMSVKDFKELRKAMKTEDEEMMVDFLSRYMGREVVDSLPLSALTAVFKAWGEASNGAEGDLTTGES